jgi:signal transduction histidine kinase/ActR/RegA family two-component response regulator
MAHDSDTQHGISAPDSSRTPLSDASPGGQGSDLAAFLAALPEPCFVLDQEWRFAHVNPLADKFLGKLSFREPGQLLGRSILQECPDVADSTFCKAAREALAENRVVELETCYPALNRWFSVLVCPTDNRLCVLLRDVSERARLERELRRRVDELAGMERGKDVFLAELAHEIRDVFATIRNALHLVGDSDLGQDETRACTLAEQGVRRLSSLVDDLVMVSQFTLALPHKQRVNLSPIIAQTLADLLVSKGEGGRTFTVDVPPEGLWLDADPKQLEQMVGHLLDNAVRSTSQAGSIRLKVAREETAIVLSVCDDGVGLIPEVLTPAFNPFTQQDIGPGSFQWGQGIGLKLVRRLAELHGGSMEAKHAGTNQGNEVIIRLPVPEEKPPTETAQSSPATPGERRFQVLVVDDSMQTAQSLSLLLTRWGCDVRLAYEGVGALEQVRAARPDLILLDLGMPGMDGYQVAKLLRQEGGDGLPLVALTGYDQDAVRDRAREAGFDYHMVKPVDPVEIKNLVDYFKSGAQRVPVPGG